MPVICRFGGGSGGGGLNFNIVGGTTQPGGKENLIWVNTETQITDWMFCVDQPTLRSDGTALSGGELWLATTAVKALTTHSNIAFNALKKQQIMVYPNCAKQYIGGSWVSVSAQIYRSGSWVDWKTYYYEEGDSHTEITGGWTRSNAYSSLDFNTDNMYMQLYAAGKEANIYPVNLIDLTGISMLYLDGIFYSSDDLRNHPAIKVWSSTFEQLAKFTTSDNDNVRMTYSLDVSAINGLCYIGFFLDNTSSNDHAGAITVYNFWGEV